MTFGPGKQMSKTRERSRPSKRRLRLTSARVSLRLRFKYKYSNPRGALGSTGMNVRPAASFLFLVTGFDTERAATALYEGVDAAEACLAAVTTGGNTEEESESFL